MPGQVAPQMQPQAQADDGYIYPADGIFERGALSGAARTAASMARKSIRASSITMDRGYAPQYAPQGYYQPRPQYQPRGLLHLSGLTGG